MPDITNIPSARVPLVDVSTGLITREWYMFLLNLFNLTGAGQSASTIQDALLSGTDAARAEDAKALDALDSVVRTETPVQQGDVSPPIVWMISPADPEPKQVTTFTFDDVMPRYEVEQFTLLSKNANGVVYLDSVSRPTTGTTLTFNGTTLTAGQTINTGNGISTADASIAVGYNRSAGGAAYIDLCAANATASTRLYRSDSGAGDVFDITNLGTGYTRFYQQGAGYMTFWVNFNERVRITSAGNTLIGYGGAATTATDGFLHVPACNGAPTGVPTIENAGNVPLVVDSANNKLYFYSGGAWRDAGP